MSTAESSSSHSKFSLLIPSTSNHYPVVCGLLGTTDIEYDYQMATDFIVLRELIGAREDRSNWLCGTSICKDSETFLLGDPACDRIVFQPPSFETVYQVPPISLRAEYLLQVAERGVNLTREDVMVLVLVGHGEEGGKFVIGDKDHNCRLTKLDLEASVRRTKAKVWLISTACYSREWESPFWSLLAAAGPGQEAPSLTVSGSEKARGGFFVNTLLAEHADAFNPNTPCSPSVDNHGSRGQQHPHDFGPNKPSRCSLMRSLTYVMEWIHHRIGRVYTNANLCSRPCPISDSHSIPFQSLESWTAALHRFPCIPPSIPGGKPSSHLASMKSVRSSAADSSPKPTSKLSAEDEAQLIGLAQHLLHFRPIQTATETPIIIKCCSLVRGDRTSKPLSDAEKCSLLSALKSRQRCQAFAVAVAKNLGWEQTVGRLGGPDGEQARLSSMISLQSEAEASGCLVKVLIRREYSVRAYLGAAAWLARIWEASGRPTIALPDWEMALQQSVCQLGPGNWLTTSSRVSGRINESVPTAGRT